MNALDNKLFIIFSGSTFQALTGQKYVDILIFKARSNSRTAALKNDVIRILAGKHRFQPEDKEAIGIWDTTENFKFINTFMMGFRIFLAIVGSLTLVVGGIGVSNIMNVVVEERTKEIGIKMALGSRSSAILAQFLMETLLLTCAGGALGLLITAGLCAAFPALGFAEYVGNPVVSPTVAGITAGLLGAIGLLAGYFPARDAARLDPVVAMKLQEGAVRGIDVVFALFLRSSRLQKKRATLTIAAIAWGSVSLLLLLVKH